jgi:hypothetical protein
MLAPEHHPEHGAFSKEERALIVGHLEQGADREAIAALPVDHAGDIRRTIQPHEDSLRGFRIAAVARQGEAYHGSSSGEHPARRRLRA